MWSATGLYTESMSDWDARRYHRLSDPQLEWGRAVLDRLAPAAGERILDLGCGTGRLTSLIAATAGTEVIGLDRSAAMLIEAGRGPTPVRYVQADGAALPFINVFDAIFSAATFHWIPDHRRLFASIHAALVGRGRLVAQCGGGPNLKRLYDRARAMMGEPRYASYFADWSDPWRFYGIAETEERLAEAGFTGIEVTLVPAPTPLAGADEFAEFVECVCLRHQLDRLPRDERAGFVRRLTEYAADDELSYTLDYWRLNISARKGRA